MNNLIKKIGKIAVLGAKFRPNRSVIHQRESKKQSANRILKRKRKGKQKSLKGGRENMVEDDDSLNGDGALDAWWTFWSHLAQIGELQMESKALR